MSRWLAHQAFLRRQALAIAVQVGIRSWLARREYERQRSAISIQSLWRMYRERKAYQQMLSRLRILQSACRGLLLRKQRADFVKKVLRSSDWPAGGILITPRSR
jgi:hypothetical protein